MNPWSNFEFEVIIPGDGPTARPAWIRGYSKQGESPRIIEIVVRCNQFYGDPKPLADHIVSLLNDK